MEDEYACEDGRCIQLEWVCDSYNDCLDGTDEAQCTRCADDMFQCHDYTCISSSKHCDGVKDCPSGLDEMGCGKNI